MVVANATGCSSIFGGNLPTTPWTVGPDGRGPAWSNSLFEDNAEFGLGLRLGIDAQVSLALELMDEIADELSDALVRELAAGRQARSREDIERQRMRVAELRVRRIGASRVLEAAIDLGPHLLDGHTRLGTAVEPGSRTRRESSTGRRAAGRRRSRRGRRRSPDRTGRRPTARSFGLVLRGVERQHRLRGQDVGVDRRRLVAGVCRASEGRHVEVVAAPVPEAHLVVGELPRRDEIGRVPVEVRDRSPLLSM